MSNEFYINHAELPEEGREVCVTRSASWLSEILCDDVYQVCGDVTFKGVIRPVGTNVTIDLTVKAPLLFHCSRCGRKNNYVYGTGINHFFNTSRSNTLDLPIEVATALDSELEITEVNSRKFDAESTVIEAFAGDLPIYPICPTECGQFAGSDSEPATNLEPEEKLDPRLMPLLAIREAMGADKKEARVKA